MGRAGEGVTLRFTQLGGRSQRSNVTPAPGEENAWRALPIRYLIHLISEDDAVGVSPRRRRAQIPKEEEPCSVYTA